MLRWCSWCQKFMGETPPLDDYRISHGLCRDCEETAGNAAASRVQIEKTRGIKLFFQDIHRSVLSREFLKAREIIERADKLEIDDISLVFGVLQPTLHNVGLMWESGLIDVGQEHAYTDIVGRTLELLYSRSPHADGHRQSSSPAVLLACVNGNSHSVGIRMLEYQLAASGIPSYLLAPGAPAAEIAAAVAKLKPRVLGLSIAISFQSSELDNIKKALAGQPQPWPEVYVGGNPIRLGYALPKDLGFKPLTDFNEFLRIAKGAANG